jgi:hypothetical protein
LLYFRDEVIATPRSGAPRIVWLGSRETFDGAVISDDGRSVTLPGGEVVGFGLVPKYERNLSYFDESSLRYLRGRPLRLRGEFAEVAGQKVFVARTLWPEDFRIDAAALKKVDASGPQDIDALVAQGKGGARGPFQSVLLWENPAAGRDFAGKAVMGFMLNGAQGDDDETHAGHFSMFTGRYDPSGSIADWMFDNFYDMDEVSEKTIIAGLVPTDKYLGDLNSGQNWYRPTDMLVMVMKDDRVPLEIQELFNQRYADYYAHKITYDVHHNPCVALVVDVLRQDGWKFPEKGRTPHPIAEILKKIIQLKAGKEAARKVFDTIREEPTRQFPRQAFDMLGGDLLRMEGVYGAETVGRDFSPLEKRIKEDMVALIYLRVPQFPSSRPFGRDAAGDVFEYGRRLPKDMSKFRTIVNPKRPYPPN